MNHFSGIGRDFRMKRIGLALGLFAAVFISGGCKQQQSDNDAIRAGIMQHLNGVGTLNMSAMEMDIRSVSINGNQAHAEVEFRPKTGAPRGAGMQVGYNLEKRNGAWLVQKTQPAGRDDPASGSEQQSVSESRRAFGHPAEFQRRAESCRRAVARRAATRSPAS